MVANSIQFNSIYSSVDEMHFETGGSLEFDSWLNTPVSQLVVANAKVKQYWELEMLS